MRISILTQLPPQTAPAVLALPLWEEDAKNASALPGLPAALSTEVRAWMKKTRFTASTGQFSYTRLPSGKGLVDLFLLGCGPAHSFHTGILRRVGGRIAVEARKIGADNLVIYLNSPLFPDVPPLWIRTLTTGLREGGYRILDGSPQNAEPALSAVHFVVGDQTEAKALQRAADRGIKIGDAINATRSIANRPGNEAPPRVIANEARALARKNGLSYSAWGRAELKKQKCGALLAVAQGSREEPYLIRLTYPGKKRTLAPLVVVGKTITFDTGGISLKPGKNMEWMKFDKCGGMTVLAFMSLIGSVIKPDRPVIGLLAAAENMPGDAATRPGDVVRSRKGTTIEIVNTDAEGRLVLADALDVAAGLKPACIINFATLTGAAMVALGRPASPIMGNHLRLRESLQVAGELSGDRVWPLPLYPEYKAALKTPFADLKNIGDGSAGTIIGGIFLQSFVPDTIPWAHIDLTSAWEERATSHGPAGATIFGAALLAQWMESGALDQL